MKYSWSLLAKLVGQDFIIIIHKIPRGWSGLNKYCSTMLSRYTWTLIKTLNLIQCRSDYNICGTVDFRINGHNNSHFYELFLKVVTSESIACALAYKYIELGCQMFFHCTVFDVYRRKKNQVLDRRFLFRFPSVDASFPALK